MGVVFTSVGFASVLMLLALIAAAIVAFHRGVLTFPTVVHTYTAFVLGACILLALSGGALLIKAAASAVIARDFSYQTADYPRGIVPPGVVAPPMPTAAERARTQAGDDLTAGITLLVIGGGLGIAHGIGNAIAARRDTVYGRVVERGFMVVMLAAGTVIGLGSGARLLNDLLRRYVVTAAPPTPYSLPLPGGALGFAVTFVPLWLIFGWRVWRALRMPRDGDGANPASTTAPLP